MGKSKLDIKAIEEKWLKYWEKEKIYKFDLNSKKEIYSIDTPPPTISGRLHIGHAFGDAQQDFFARYKRMKGFNVLNPFGTDNNGLPTLKLVEKEKKVRAREMTREEFIKLCFKTIKEEFIPSFVQDSKRLGISADYSIFYDTIDDRSRRISQKSFIDLYKQGREYRIDAPALWCTQCQTTVAQVELEDKEIDSTFNDIVFKVDGKDLVVATTRPELLPAIVAIFYHPNDKRYSKYKGKTAKVPLFDIEVPILEDKNADPEKGTGIVMCCTFGDQMDMVWQKTHNLEIKMAIGPDGKMTELADKYAGMKIKEARKTIMKDLKEAGLLLKQKPIKHPVNTHERCGTEIEFIKSKQWFVKYLDLKKDMLKWGTEIKWYPKHMKVRYDNWIKGLGWDWCISRQIPFGIPFPVWYCKKCDETILAEEKDLPIDPVESNPPVKKCPKCESTEFIPEIDIMNTWATSALTPEIIKDLLKETKAYDKIKNKPFSIRRNGPDIITFWDFNTIVKSQLHNKKNPWNELFINGWLLNEQGKKISKSKGDALTPQKIIQDHSADILRYLCASATLGENLPFPEKELIAGKKFITKLLNAAKFVFMNLEHQKEEPKLIETDRLLLSKLNKTISLATKYFDAYSYSKAKAETESFFWKTLADNYLEIVKYRVYNGSNEEKASAFYTLYTSLLIITKMFAPFTPFITEEVYQEHFAKYEKKKSIHLEAWPEKLKIKIHEDDSKIWNKLVEVITKVRQAKSENQKSMNSPIKLTIPKDDSKILDLVKADLKAVTTSEDIQEGDFRVEFVEKE